MASQPLWITPPGSLGVVPEGTFYSVPLQATDTDLIDINYIEGNGSTVTIIFDSQPTSPYQIGDQIIVANASPSSYNGTFVALSGNLTQVTFSSSNTDQYFGGGTVSTVPSEIYYTVIAGELPSGVQCTLNGVIQGVPTNMVTVANATVSLGSDVTSKFAIRAYTTQTVNGITVINRLADRTFTLTVSGPNTPAWITPPGSLGDFFDGQLLIPGIQLQYTDDNITGIPPAVTLISGSLPPGLNVSSTGLISGFIGFNPNIGVLAGFSRDNQGFSEYPFDFSTESNNYTYEFVLQLTDGKNNVLQTFTMFVWSTTTFSADTTLITADDTVLTASISSQNIPVLLNPQGSIGTTQSNTYFAYQFNGLDIAGDIIGYIGLNIPPGLTLDPLSGFLYGYLPTLNVTEITYTFSVRVYQYYNPSAYSDYYNYSLTVQGTYYASATWITPPNLGSIATGSTSTFYVAATNSANYSLQYRLLSGSDSQLPQGLQLLSSGNIVGRVGFNTFALDNGTTTFDNNTTTFDLVFSFTVNAFSNNGAISITQTFTITVLKLYSIPYNNLYIQCMPPLDDRALIGNLLENVSIFNPALIYRADDSNFGVSSKVIYYHAYGLDSVSQDTYVQALQLNHYWKNLVLGEIKTAQAIDPTTGNVLYEVVYSEVIDDLVNNSNISVEKEVVTPYPVTQPVAWPWNPNYSGAGILLTYDNTKATGTNALTIDNATVLGSVPIVAGQKIMFSVTQYVWAPLSDDTGIGIGNINTLLSEWAGYTINSAALYDGGSWWANETQITTGLPTFQNNDVVIDVAVDRANDYIWFRVNGGNWNNDISADPGTTTGGLDISFLTGDVYPAYTPAYDTTHQVGSQMSTNPTSLFQVPVGFDFMIYNEQTSVVYPNSLDNMRTQVIDVVGQESQLLPLWMQSKQANGQVLGFTPAWVIAYTVPGGSGQLQYNINTQFGEQLNLVDFKADRYEFDNALTVNWDANAQSWIPSPPEATTFDILYHYDFAIASGGTGFQPGDIVKILGSQLNGTDGPYDPANNQFGNDCIFVVNTVNKYGSIVSAFCYGTASLNGFGQTYLNVVGTTITGQGINSWWNIVVVPGRNNEITTYIVNWTGNLPNLYVAWANNNEYTVQWISDNPGMYVFDTIFDGGSTNFISPSDQNTNTDAYNKYLMYPKRNILQ